jgi:hypothetical protein
VIASAAANIAFKLMADGVFIKLLALAVDDVDGRHDHARGTEAALQTMLFMERLLHRVQTATLAGNTFNRGNDSTFAGRCQRRAAFDGLAINMHGASAALTGITADVGTGQFQMIPDKFNKQCATFNVAAHGFAVHFHIHCWHRFPPGQPFDPNFLIF